MHDHGGGRRGIQHEREGFGLEHVVADHPVADPSRLARHEQLVFGRPGRCDGIGRGFGAHPRRRQAQFSQHAFQHRLGRAEVYLGVQGDHQASDPGQAVEPDRREDRHLRLQLQERPAPQDGRRGLKQVRFHPCVPETLGQGQQVGRTAVGRSDQPLAADEADLQLVRGRGRRPARREGPGEALEPYAYGVLQQPGRRRPSDRSGQGAAGAAVLEGLHQGVEGHRVLQARSTGVEGPANVGRRIVQV